MPLLPSALAATTADRLGDARSFSPLPSVPEAVGGNHLRVAFEDEGPRRHPLSTEGPPAERERAENRLPMAADGRGSLLTW